mmetsp:Transcript_29990/g.77737  ORF Transcript_29990/g.77737 Transcript_29990/m.77737 type:complete len:215 (+) Transcript_29990:300-944(+)
MPPNHLSMTANPGSPRQLSQARMSYLKALLSALTLEEDSRAWVRSRVVPTRNHPKAWSRLCLWAWRVCIHRPYPASMSLPCTKRQARSSNWVGTPHRRCKHCCASSSSSSCSSPSSHSSSRSGGGGSSTRTCPIWTSSCGSTTSGSCSSAARCCASSSRSCSCAGRWCRKSSRRSGSSGIRTWRHSARCSRRRGCRGCRIARHVRNSSGRSSSV